jgi:hypothetical protein
MKLEIEVNEGDDLTWLKVWRDHSALLCKCAPDPWVRLSTGGKGVNLFLEWMGVTASFRQSKLAPTHEKS